MKLCDYCIANVLESKASWDYHSHSYDALIPSTKDQCLFCSTLRKDIRRVAPWLKEWDYAGSWPVYRWSIRSLAKIRESPETVVVTFRYVPPAKRPDGMASVEEEDIELPTRIFLLFPDSELQPLPSLTQLGNTTDPNKNGGYLIRNWMETCDSTHTDCMRRLKTTPKASRFVPSRLLDISGPPKSPIRVIETATTSIHGPYCSLSHCWGLLKFKECELHDNNRKQFMTEGVAWNLLTKNFQQAIEVARFLDVGYIWIDSLCIIQGSAEDWKREASRMHLVYRNSYCNIAIVDAADKNGGAFRDRVPENILPTLYSPRADLPMFRGKKAWRVVLKDMWESELLQSFLYVRAWVFQERMLAPRILHFARNQVFWDCPSLSACEALSAGLPRPMDSSSGPDRHWRGRLQIQEVDDLTGGNDQPLSSYWQTAVRKYTSCNITNRSDKLIALWGIAKLVKDAMLSEYAEGLWEENLEDQLAWRVAECRLEKRPDTPANRKIPSWSWASMDGEIIVADRLSDQKHWTVRDHNGRPLSLDLVGVKRYVQPTPSTFSQHVPFLQQRVKSDGFVQTKTTKTNTRGDGLGRPSTIPFGEDSRDKAIDNDAEPVLHTNSIPIQGHISNGLLNFNELKKAWILHPCNRPDLDMEAHPDTLPGSKNLQHSTQFVVLSAKKVVRPKSDVYCAGTEDLEQHTDIDVEGHGIILENATSPCNGHYRRTGAFRFHFDNEDMFHSLLVTAVSDTLTDREFDPHRGRKFWLD